jgi:hypothetical protein
MSSASITRNLSPEHPFLTRVTILLPRDEKWFGGRTKRSYSFYAYPSGTHMVHKEIYSIYGIIVSKETTKKTN